MKLFITAVLTAFALGEASGSSYGYNSSDQDHGPAHWFALTDIANNTCGGEKQSPIDIATTLAATSECDLYKDYKFLVSLPYQE
jgi:carbonic anhydrase